MRDRTTRTCYTVTGYTGVGPTHPTALLTLNITPDPVAAPTTTHGINPGTNTALEAKTDETEESDAPEQLHIQFAPPRRMIILEKSHPQLDITPEYGLALLYRTKQIRAPKQPTDQTDADGTTHAPTKSHAQPLQRGAKIHLTFVQEIKKAHKATHATARPQYWHGLSLDEIASSITGGNSSTIITGVMPGSPAAKASLQPGHQIIAVNRKPVPKSTACQAQRKWVSTQMGQPQTVALTALLTAPPAQRLADPPARPPRNKKSPTKRKRSAKQRKAAAPQQPAPEIR